VPLAFCPRFLDRLLQLPRVESLAQAFSDRLWALRPLVVAKPEVIESQHLWQHPAFATILRQPSLDAGTAVTTVLRDSSS
jgi:hypothetical protein